MTRVWVESLASRAASWVLSFFSTPSSSVAHRCVLNQRRGRERDRGERMELKKMMLERARRGGIKWECDLTDEVLKYDDMDVNIDRVNKTGVILISGVNWMVFRVWGCHMSSFIVNGWFSDFHKSSVSYWLFLNLNSSVWITPTTNIYIGVASNH